MRIEEERKQEEIRRLEIEKQFEASKVEREMRLEEYRIEQERIRIERESQLEAAR